MSDLTDSQAELMAAYQEVADTAATLTHDGETVDVMPSIVGNDPVFVGGGTAESEQFEVATLASDWSTPPDDNDVVALAGHETAPNASYQVLSRKFTEAWIVFTLGNTDGR